MNKHLFSFFYPFRFLKFLSLKESKGQAMVESLILLPLSISCFFLCLLFFFLYAQYLWIDHQLYQALICSAEGKPQTKCIHQMKKKIKSFLWWGDIKDIKLKKHLSGFQGFFIWKNLFWNLSFRKQIQI